MKVTNTMLARYHEIDSQIKALESEKESLRRDIAKTGTCQTKDFICQVSTSTYERMVGLSEALAKVGKTTLNKLGLTAFSDRTTIKVLVKERKAA